MSDYLLMAIAGTLIFIAAVLIFLLREHKKLRQDYLLLADRLRRNNEDVAGLCSAAVAVDQHLASSEARLNGIIEMVNAYRSPPPVSPSGGESGDSSDDQTEGYDKAIQKIRYGAGVDELVKDCGLTRDEAVLLIRLHGGKR